MKKSLFLLILVSGFILGCRQNYQEKGLMNITGFKKEKLGLNRYMISYKDVTNHHNTFEKALVAAADIALENKIGFFSIEDILIFQGIIRNKKIVRLEIVLVENKPSFFVFDANQIKALFGEKKIAKENDKKIRPVGIRIDHGFSFLDSNTVLLTSVSVKSKYHNQLVQAHIDKCIELTKSNKRKYYEILESNYRHFKIPVILKRPRAMEHIGEYALKQSSMLPYFTYSIIHLNDQSGVDVNAEVVIDKTLKVYQDKNRFSKKSPGTKGSNTENNFYGRSHRGLFDCFFGYGEEIIEGKWYTYRYDDRDFINRFFESMLRASEKAIEMKYKFFEIDVFNFEKEITTASSQGSNSLGIPTVNVITYGHIITRTSVYFDNAINNHSFQFNASETFKMISEHYKFDKNGFVRDADKDIEFETITTENGTASSLEIGKNLFAITGSGFKIRDPNIAIDVSMYHASEIAKKKNAKTFYLVDGNFDVNRVNKLYSQNLFQNLFLSYNLIHHNYPYYHYLIISLEPVKPESLNIGLDAEIIQKGLVKKFENYKAVYPPKEK